MSCFFGDNSVSLTGLFLVQNRSKTGVSQQCVSVPVINKAPLLTKILIDVSALVIMAGLWRWVHGEFGIKAARMLVLYRC